MMHSNMESNMTNSLINPVDAVLSQDSGVKAIRQSKEDKELIPKSKKNNKKPTLYLNKEKLEMLREKSARRGISLNKVVNIGIEYFLNGGCDLSKVINDYNYSSIYNTNKHSRLPLSIDPETHKKLKNMLKGVGVKINFFAERILDRWFESPESDVRIALRDFQPEPEKETKETNKTNK